MNCNREGANSRVSLTRALAVLAFASFVSFAASRESPLLFHSHPVITKGSDIALQKVAESMISWLFT